MDFVLWFCLSPFKEYLGHGQAFVLSRAGLACCPDGPTDALLASSILIPLKVGARADLLNTISQVHSNVPSTEVMLNKC